MNEKQQQLTFNKGITNIPSDALCDDNELEVSENIVYRDSEHQPIQDPVKILSLTSGQLLFVHKPYGSEEKYIVQKSNGDIHWVTTDDEELTEDNFISSDFVSGKVELEAVGNTLVISDDESRGFFKWTDDKYKALGNSFEEPQVLFREKNYNNRISGTIDIPDETAYLHQVIVDLAVRNDFIEVRDAGKVNWENAMVGLYSQLKYENSQEGLFWAPFFVRVAVELYDGSYILHSAPILLFPSVRKNCVVRPTALHDDESGSIRTLQMFLMQADAELKANFDYSDYEDVVKGVSLFMSEQKELNYTSYLPNQPYFNTQNKMDSIVSGAYKEWSDIEIVGGAYSCVTPFRGKTDGEIVDSLKETSLFYKVADLGTKREDSDYHSFRDFITREKYQNLAAQPQLKDDYFSHCNTIGEDMDVYNSRLIYAGIKRTPYEGHKHFTSIVKDVGDSRDYTKLDVYVRIESQDGRRIVKTEMWSGTENLRYYFFYPDQQAKEVWAFFTNGACVFHEMLVEHPYLNGAYYMSELPDANAGDFKIEESIPAPEIKDDAIFLNQIMFSEVSNPFVFTAKGVTTFGMGELLELTTTTQALTMAAFGPQPLLAFTTKGVWSISIDKEGYPDSSDSISREVLIKDGPLCNTDGAVFFATKKGLMLIVGNDVRCVSEKLMGDFPRRLATSFIAYDYRDSLLWIIPKSNTGEETAPYCYIYNIKTGTFHTSTYFAPHNQGESEEVINSPSAVVNNYPDTLFQKPGDGLYSLMERPQPTDDENTYNGVIMTRPMKLENALALKSIMQIRHIKSMDGTITMRILASNNMKEWVELHSLRGIPWLYYKFSFVFSNMPATDRFAGTMLITQERRTNKMR